MPFECPVAKRNKKKKTRRKRVVHCPLGIYRELFFLYACDVVTSVFRGDNGGGIGNRRSGGRGGQKGSQGTGKSGRGKPGRGVTVSSIPGTTLGFLKVMIVFRILSQIFFLVSVFFFLYVFLIYVFFYLYGIVLRTMPMYLLSRMTSVCLSSG